MIETKQVTEFIFPVKVVACSDDVINAEQLLNHKHLAVPLVECQKTTIPKGGYIILDFGKEYSGGIRILHTFANSEIRSTPLRLRFGESLGEVMHDVGFMGTTNDHNHRDFIYRIPNLSDVTVGNTGFRFIRIDNMSEGGVLNAVAIVLAYTHIDAKQMGYFECDDSRINQIYDVATRTAFMCSQNGYLVEAIKRDRLVWAGDMNVQVIANLDSYGDLDVIRRTLEFLIEAYPLPGWMNSMPTYSLWFLCYLKETFLLNGDTEWISGFIPYVRELVNQISSCISSEGELDFYKSNTVIAMDYFIDWPNWSKPGCKESCYALTKLALEASLTILSEKDGEVARDCIARLKKPGLDLNVSKGLRAIYELAFGPDHPECLLQDGYKTTSTFLSYAIYKAMAKQGNTKEAVQIMKDFYGLMLDINATTFFEDYQPEWVGGKIDEFPGDEKPYFHANYGSNCYIGYRLSLCHAWSSGPSPFLIEEVAGIKVVDSNTYKIEPSLGDLKYVNAARATKLGAITVNISKKPNGELDIKYTAPEGIRVIL